MKYSTLFILPLLLSSITCITIEVEKYPISKNFTQKTTGEIKFYHSAPKNRLFIKLAKVKIRDFSSRMLYKEIKDKIKVEIVKLGGNGAYFIKKKQSRSHAFMLDSDGKAGKHRADKNNMIFVEAIIFAWETKTVKNY